MESLAALSLASNVIQFIDFGSKLVLRFKEICNSADGVLKENAELSDMAIRLKQLAKPLTKPLTEPLAENRCMPSDPDLKHIAERCNEVADELIQLLESLKLLAQKEHKKWNLIRIMVKGAIKERQIADLSEKLQRLQQELNSRLLFLLNDSMSKQIGEVIDANQALRIETKLSLEAIIHDLKDFRYLSQHLLQLPQIGQQLDFLTKEVEIAIKNRRILKSLRYNVMHERFEDIREAYGNTFRWVFDNADLQFSRWLQSDSFRTYWITGKPGSGKSTLMKYIHQQPKTQKLLVKWSGTKQLVLANHSFWNSGDQLQKCQTGLLRSLLFQILRQCPAWISSICMERWNEDEVASEEPWNLRLLSSCFERLANHNAPDTKICLFIDGLDEYEGDHRELVLILRRLVTSRNSQHFKLCISSRPWNVFEAEYGRLEEKVHVEAFTRDDISSYVQDHLNQDDYLNKIFATDAAQALELISMITIKAQGVFLWVFYVIRLLLRTAVDAPSISELKAMIDEYPDEMGPLFERILSGIPKAYHQDTAEMFRIFLESAFPLPLSVLKFAELEKRNPGYATDRLITKFTQTEVEGIEEFRRRIKGRCMDFIDIHVNHVLVGEHANYPFLPEVYRYQVDFFHRTVRDFLGSKSEWLNRRTGSSFNVHVTLCKANLALFKALPPGFDLVWQRETVIRFIAQFFASAYQLEANHNIPMADMLEEVDKVFGFLNKNQNGIHWSEFTAWTDSPETHRDLGTTDFLCVSVQSGLHLYVKKALDRNDPRSRRTKGRPLLGHALWAEPLLVGFSTLNPNMVQLLLEKGADPNEKYEYGLQSVWCDFLVHTVVNEKLYNQRLDIASAETIELLLQYGAEPDAKCIIPASFKQNQQSDKILESGDLNEDIVLTVYELLKKFCPNEARLLDLLEELAKEVEAETQALGDV